MKILFEVIQVLMGVISGIFLTLGVINIRGLHKNPNRIGTIVVDRSDESANIFLEIEHDDIEKWENGKDYYVRVEVRDYVPHE